MKKNIIISALLIILVSIVYTQLPTKTIIHGHILENSPHKVSYTLPINGVCNPNFKETVAVDSFGQFTIELRISKTSFLDFTTAQKHCFIIEPGNVYDVEFIDDILIVENPSDAQLFYSSLPQEYPRLCTSLTPKKIEECSITNQCFETQLDKELNLLDAEYAKRSISKEQYQLIKAERQVYYKTFQAIAFVQHYLTSKDSISYDSHQLKRLWSNAMVGIDLSDPIVQQTSNFYDFLDFYLWGEIYTSDNSKSFLELRKIHKENGTAYTHIINTAEKYLPQNYLEYYTASYLSTWSRQKRNQSVEEFITLEEQFNRNYPHSEYAYFFDDNINKIAMNTNK